MEGEVVNICVEIVSVGSGGAFTVIVDFSLESPPPPGTASAGMYVCVIMSFLWINDYMSILVLVSLSGCSNCVPQFDPPFVVVVVEFIKVLISYLLYFRICD